MNEPRRWTFLCIWYENRGVGVYEIERLPFPLYMALCMPLLLRQRTSRVYQDHQHLCRVLTSFVPPVHNQGVSLAPLQGHALWIIFLPTTGSFFVISLTVLHGYRAGTLRWTFRPACSTCLPAFPVMTGLSSRRRLPEAQSSRGRVLSVLIPAVMQPVPAAS